MIVCSKCGTELEEGQKFCFECGTPAPQLKKCIKCGAELDPKMKFCPECGAKQDEELKTKKKKTASKEGKGKTEEPKIQRNASDYSFDELFEMEHDSHDAQVQFFISEKYKKQRNYEKSFEWVKKSADQKNPDGIACLGWHYLYGNGLLCDRKRGMDLINESIKNGESAYGQNLLGQLYESGRGVEKNYPEAISWYTKSAEQGNPKAQNNLGRIYRIGISVKIDYPVALFWYKKAAGQGNADARDNYLDLYNSIYGL